MKFPDHDKKSEAGWWQILLDGLRTFTSDNGFSKALLGLSGGMDSTLVALIATEVLGAQNVLGVYMPSPYSSQTSRTDALEFAANLSMPTMTMPITGIMAAYDQTLSQAFAGTSPDKTEENIQARIRGTLLMALSNKLGAILLATGNKSELGTGYCTLYGDMAGAISVIGDLTKTKVYALGRWINQVRGPLIPESIFRKPPSAELRPGQTDQDSLPPYELLDPILERWLNGHPSLEQMESEGFDPELAKTVIGLAIKNRFKILQAPPVISLTNTPLNKSLFRLADGL